MVDNNLSKLVKILISEQIALAVIFKIGKGFNFWRPVNKNMLEWLLLIISKKYTLTTSTNCLGRNIMFLPFHIMFLIKKRLADL